MVGILAGLVLAMTGAAPASAVAKRANHTKVPPTSSGSCPSSIRAPATQQPMSAAGVESVRLLVYWQGVQPSPGVYDWSYYDSVISEHRRGGTRGLRPVRLIRRNWISDARIVRRSTAAADRSLAELLDRFARRYGPRGSFWAEHPNLRYRPVRSLGDLERAESLASWGGPPNAARLPGAVLSPASRRSARVDPAARIVFGGLLPLRRRSADGVNGAKFLTGSTPVPAARKIVRRALAAPVLGHAPDLVPTCEHCASSSIGTAAAASPIWITELGWSTSGRAGAPDLSHHARRGTRSTSTRSYNALIKARRTLRGSSGSSGELRDDVVTADTSADSARWGLLRADGSATGASYLAISAAGVRR